MRKNLSQEQQNSIEKLINELIKRIDLLNEPTLNSNLNAENYNQIKTILTKYLRANQTLNTDILKKIEVGDLRSILVLVGLDDETVDKYVYSFNNNINKSQSNDVFNLSNTEFLTLYRYFENIKNIICDYLEQYESINSTQKQSISSKKELYSRYIEYFNQEEQTELFTNFDELYNLLTSLALPKSDIWHIQEYIANQNINAKEFAVIDFSLSKKIQSITDRYLTSNEELVKQISYDLQGDTDIECIPILSEELSKKYKIDVEQIQNIVVSLLISSLYDKYKNILISVGGITSESQEVMNLIKETMSYYIDEYTATLTNARNLISETSEFYEHSIQEQQDDIMLLVEVTINDLVNQGYLEETAIDLKTLPLIKKIRETVNNLSSKSMLDDDYELGCSIVYDLLAAYENIINKKQLKQ